MRIAPVVTAVTGLFARDETSVTCEPTGEPAGRTCQWEDKRPWCGGTDFELGECTSEGRQLVAWTRDHTLRSLITLRTETTERRFHLSEALSPCIEQFSKDDCLIGFRRLTCDGPKVCPSRPTGNEELLTSPLPPRSTRRCWISSTRRWIRPVPKTKLFAFGRPPVPSKILAARYRPLSRLRT